MNKKMIKYYNTDIDSTVGYVNNPIELDREFNNDFSNKIVIVTHNGRFHADEVVGVALLQLFIDRYIKLPIVLVRIPHANSIKELESSLKELGVPHYNYVLDTGRVYDGVSYFDHHQEDVKHMELPLATAGKILSYVKHVECILHKDTIDKDRVSLFRHNEIYSLCKLVDENDLGIKPADKHSIPYVISHLQSLDFDLVLGYIRTYLNSIINVKNSKQIMIDDILKHTKKIPNTNFRVQYNDSILDDVNLDSWNRIVNQNDFEEIIHGIVTYSRKDGKWKIHTMPLGDNTYEKSGPSLPQDDAVDFIHTAGFIAADHYKETLLEYIERHFSVNE